MERDKQELDTKKFMALLLPNQREIHVFVRYLVPCKADADDILQETLTEMWNKFHEYQDGTNFVAWGVAIAKYKVMTFIRKKKNSGIPLDEKTIQIIHDHTSSTQFHSTTTERTEALKECISKLPPKQKKILSLRYEQELTFDRIAKYFGLSIPAIYKTLSRIHMSLAKCIRMTLSVRGIL